MDTSTKLSTDLESDSPAELGAEFRASADVRRKIDNQILAIQDHIVDSVISGCTETWALLSGSSADVVKGDCVCLAGVAAVDGIPVVTKAVAAALTVAKSVVGIVRVGAGGNNRVRIVLSGMVDPTVTGLGAEAAGAVRCNVTTARCQSVGAMGATDYPVGSVDTHGNLTVAVGPTPTAAGFIGGSSAGITYTLSVSSADLVTEDWVCLAAEGSTVVTKAIPAAVAVAGGVLGVVTGAYNAGDSDVVVYSAGATGDLPISLGAGVASIIALDSSARAYRVPIESGGELRLGIVATDGSVTVQPRPMLLTAPHHTYNPKTFGCPWDGIHDDLPGFEAMMLAIPDVGGRIDLPPGMGYFSDNLNINKPVKIYGHGGGTTVFTSGFTFPAGKGMYCNGYYVTTAGTSEFDGGAIHDCSFQSQCLIYGDQAWHINHIRTANTYFALGKVIHTFNTTCFFRVTTAGTTSSGADPAFSSTIAGATYTDGGVTWTSEMYCQDWVLNHSYRIGDRVFVPGETPYYFECETAGPSGATIPGDFSSPTICALHAPATGQLIAEGPDTLHWRAHTHAGIVLTAPFATFSHVYFMGFTGYAMHIQTDGGNTPPTYGDFTNIHTGGAQYCGGGILTYQFDSNVITVHNFNTLFMGIGAAFGGRTSVGAPNFAGGHTIWDKGLVNQFHNCYAQDGFGPAYRTGASSGGVFVACRSENGHPDYLQGANSIVIGSSGVTDDSGGIVITPGGGRNLFETTAGAPIPVTAGLTVQGAGAYGGSHWFTSTDEASNQFWGWRYQYPNGSTGVAGTGWYAFSYGGQSARVAYGVSGAKAAEGPGHPRFYDGYFVGQEAQGARYRGQATLSLLDTQMRGGHQLVGDKFAFQCTGVPGTFDEYVVSVAGYRGFRWATGLGIQAALDDPYYVRNIGLFADLIEPSTHTYPIPASGGRVFKVMVGSTTGSGSEPNWASAPNTGDTVTLDGRTYKNVGTVAEYTRGTFIDDPVIGYTPQAKISWEDSASTDATTAAPKTAVPGQRFDAVTSATTANQVLASFTLVNNTVNMVDVVVEGKIAATANATAAKLSGAFVVNGSTITRLGGDVASTPQDNGTLAGSTFNLNINGLVIEVRATPAAATATHWHVVIQDVKGKD